MRPSFRRGKPFWREPSFAGIVAVHGVALVALVHWQVNQPGSPLAQLLQVRLIEPERPSVIEPKPLPPPPKPTPRPAVVQTPPPVLTAAAEAPAPAPTFAVAPQPPAPPAPAPIQPAPAPLATTAARFDADYLHNPKPVYPPASRRLGEEGKVVLRVRVGADGAALEVEIKQGSGFSRLDAAARAAVSQWRFVPARRGNEAVESWVAVPIQFNLES